MSHVTCHMSPVTCHVSSVKCQIYFFLHSYYLKERKKLDKKKLHIKKYWTKWWSCRWRVCYQRGLPLSNLKNCVFLVRTADKKYHWYVDILGTLQSLSVLLLFCSVSKFSPGKRKVFVGTRQEQIYNLAYSWKVIFEGTRQKQVNNHTLAYIEVWAIILKLGFNCLKPLNLKKNFF